MNKTILYLFSVFFCLVSSAAFSQTPGQGIGRVLSQEDIAELMYTVGPEGKELPEGQGTAREGEQIYTQNCIFCHGPEGLNGPQNTLKGGARFPFATSIWDYIHRAMPRSIANVGVQGRQLSVDETYALTAYLLYINGIVDQDTVLDTDLIMKIEMPMEKKPVN
ncbi:MAG: cytochrome c [Gammaproteobacteria bacterium]|nr:cytochrome c [Gammaproteobacteria bacterium]